jgi:aspartate aminotransferase-like enzyme
VDVAPEVLAAQARPILSHQSPEFAALYARLIERLQPLFGTTAPIFLCGLSATALQEIALRNLVHQQLLICVNGAASERWVEVGRANGKTITILESDAGDPILPDRLSTVLQQTCPEAVAIVHNESACGVQNPLPELLQVVQQTCPQALTLVDAVSSLGGVPIAMDALGIDCLFTDSQHCLALPPGLGLIALSERALNVAGSIPNRGWAYDLLRLERLRLRNTVSASLPIPLLYALDVQLDRIQAEGLENRFARHASLSHRLQAWATGRGLPILAAAPHRSHTVTVLENKFGWNIQELNKFLSMRGMKIANGYGKLKDSTLRIASMGETQMYQLEELLSSLDEWIAKG